MTAPDRDIPRQQRLHVPCQRLDRKTGCNLMNRKEKERGLRASERRLVAGFSRRG